MKSEKILVIGPSWVGDMIMAQALFKKIKSDFPDATIDMLAPDWSIPICDRMPEINKKITLHVGHGKLGLMARYKLAKKLRSENYSRAILLANTFKSALIPFWAKIKIRTGWVGEFRYGLVNDIRKLDKTKYPKMVERYLALGCSKGEILPDNYAHPRLEVDKINQQTLINKFELSKVSNNLTYAMCPGAAYGMAKCWPPEYFAEISINNLAKGNNIWFFGSNKDKPVIEKILQLIKTKIEDNSKLSQLKSFAGMLSLFETVDMLDMADKVITNDSGLMHMAASVDKPLVAIYGPTSPSFTPPLGSKCQVLKRELDCSPCFKRECPLGHHDCMRSITPSEVEAML